MLSDFSAQKDIHAIRDSITRHAHHCVGLAISWLAGNTGQCQSLPACSGDKANATGEPESFPTFKIARNRGKSACVRSGRQYEQSALAAGCS